MTTIINLTQHGASTEQVEAGVVDCGVQFRPELAGILTFVGLPTKEEIKVKAQALACLASGHGYSRALIGGAPYLMGPLEEALKAEGVQPLYAFSERVSVEETLPDGSVRKVAAFRHLGFVEA